MSQPTLLSLVALFGRVGCLAFGGGVTSHLMHHFITRGWLTPEGYLEALNWCQNLPGPNATNLSAYLGWRYAGPLGALLCTVALVAPGAVAVLGLSYLLTQIPNAAVVTGALMGVAAAAVGLLIGALAQLIPSAALTPLRTAGAVASGVAVALGLPTPLAIALAVLLLWPRGPRKPDAGPA